MKAKIMEIYLAKDQDPPLATLNVSWYYDKKDLRSAGVTVPKFISSAELFESNHF
jgi:hypothetical protein